MGRHTPKHEHQWIYASDLCDAFERYICDCGAAMTEPGPTVEGVNGL